jgi:hypothetical protein
MLPRLRSSSLSGNPRLLEDEKMKMMDVDVDLC